MTLEQLKALNAVVKYGGFRPASEALFKSQSAISIAIRKLEEELNITLFHRDQYRPTLTEEGHAIYEKAKGVLSHADELANLAGHFSVGEEPRLNVAMSAVVPVEQPLSLFNKITEQYPATRLSLLIETLNGAMERLDDDDADIAIMEVFEQQSGYIYADLIQTELVSVVSARSRFVDQVHTLTEKDMAGTTQIIVRDSSRHSEKKTAGVVKDTHHWVVSDFMTKKKIIVSGTGWGRMPLHMVEEEIKCGDLVMLSSEEFQPLKVDIKAARKKDRLLGPVATELWQQLQNIDWH